MSRARTLAGAIGSDGALNVADVAGLAAVASSGSASDLSTGTLPLARLPNTGFELGMRNRIINGAMMIDQRNAGASVTFSGTSQPASMPIYASDRFGVFAFGPSFPSGVYLTNQQVADAPSGFTYSNKITANQALTINSTNTRGVWVAQQIEGYNFLDCWNQTLTLSFWVKTSNVGTYSLCFQGNNAAYATSYTVNSANTWEKKTITFTHSTSLYTPSSTNGQGMGVLFGLGGDSTWIGTATANQWVTGNVPYLHGCKNLFDTAGATWQITGVQLEKGSTATSFDYRPYGTELALCQRYYYMLANGTAQSLGVGWFYAANSGSFVVPFPVTMRSTPSIEKTTGSNYYSVEAGGYTINFTGNFTINNGSSRNVRIYENTSLSGATTGQGCWFYTNNASSFVGFSAEL